jgi:hypothetical protein
VICAPPVAPITTIKTGDWVEIDAPTQAVEVPQASQPPGGDDETS